MCPALVAVVFHVRFPCLARAALPANGQAARLWWSVFVHSCPTWARVSACASRGQCFLRHTGQPTPPLIQRRSGYRSALAVYGSTSRVAAAFSFVIANDAASSVRSFVDSLSM